MSFEDARRREKNQKEKNNLTFTHALPFSSFSSFSSTHTQVLCPPQPLPERRLLLGHLPAGHGHPPVDVYCRLRRRALHRVERAGAFQLLLWGGGGEGGGVFARAPLSLSHAFSSSLFSLSLYFETSPLFFQWMEMAAAAPGAAPKIARPRQIYTGQTARPFLPAHERGGGCASAGCVTRAGSGGKLSSILVEEEAKGKSRRHHHHHHHHGHSSQPVAAVATGR